MKKIIIWLSWWPDSMFLTYLLIKHMWKKNIILAHFNHSFRKESDMEEKKIKKLFKWYNLVTWKYNWNCFSESCLRKARFEFFKKNWRWKYWLFLWHNLTDRIETSIINMLRWWWIDWFLNMRKIDYDKKIVRPLLNISKNDIQKKCDILDIPYFVDQTNFDEKVSLRNLIRTNILNILENINYNFYYSFKNLYNQIENIYPKFNIDEYLVFVNENIFLLKLPNDNKEFFIKKILDKFWVRDLRWWVINEILDYFNNSKWWWFKKYWKIKFYKKKWNIYLQIWQTKSNSYNKN